VSSRFVYLAIAANGLHKIGWSRTPTERMRTVATEASSSVRLLHQIQTEHATWLKGYLHRRFETKCVRGEWFRLDDADVAYIRSLVTDHVAALWEQTPEDKRIRLIIDTDDAIRRAVHLRALKMGSDVTNSDVVNDILREALADEIAEVKSYPSGRGTGRKPGRKRKDD
jgi:hypothetical protein